MIKVNFEQIKNMKKSETIEIFYGGSKFQLKRVSEDSFEMESPFWFQFRGLRELELMCEKGLVRVRA